MTRKSLQSIFDSDKGREQFLKAYANQNNSPRLRHLNRIFPAESFKDFHIERNWWVLLETSDSYGFTQNDMVKFDELLMKIRQSGHFRKIPNDDVAYYRGKYYINAHVIRDVKGSKNAPPSRAELFWQNVKEDVAEAANLVPDLKTTVQGTAKFAKTVLYLVAGAAAIGVFFWVGGARGLVDLVKGTTKRKA